MQQPVLKWYHESLYSNYISLYICIIISDQICGSDLPSSNWDFTVEYENSSSIRTFPFSIEDWTLVLIQHNSIRRTVHIRTYCCIYFIIIIIMIMIINSVFTMEETIKASHHIHIQLLPQSVCAPLSTMNPSLILKISCRSFLLWFLAKLQ